MGWWKMSSDGVEIPDHSDRLIVTQAREALGAAKRYRCPGALNRQGQEVGQQHDAK